MKVCIASSKAPKAGDFEEFIAALKEEEEPGVLEVKGVVLTFGNCCWNYGIIVEGSGAENWVNRLTLCLMPAKWCRVADSDPAVVVGQFEDTREVQTGKTLVLIQAYGRALNMDKEKVEKDWKEGKDFKLMHGPYCSIRDVDSIRRDGYDEIVVVGMRNEKLLTVKLGMAK